MQLLSYSDMIAVANAFSFSQLAEHLLHVQVPALKVKPQVAEPNFRQIAAGMEENNQLDMASQQQQERPRWGPGGGGWFNSNRRRKEKPPDQYECFINL